MFLRSVMPLLFVVAGCSGATYYVDANIGTDSNPGTQALPFKTINRGTGALNAGDTLLVGPGIYPESIINNIPPGTDSSNPVTIQALNPCTPPIIQPTAASGVYHVIDIETYRASTAQYIVLNGLVIDGRNLVYLLGSSSALKISGSATHITILNSEIAYAPDSGIEIDHTSPGYVTMSNLNVHDNGRPNPGTTLAHGIYIATSNTTVTYSQIHDNAGWGVHVYTSAGTANNDTVTNNSVYSNAKYGSGFGIGLYSGTGHVAMNNSVWGNLNGINVAFGASGASVESNNVLDNGNYGILIGSASSSTRVIANTVLGSQVNIQDDSSSTVVLGNTIPAILLRDGTPARSGFSSYLDFPEIVMRELLAATKRTQTLSPLDCSNVLNH